jgi:DNA-binding transcriptional ArsR family regulator
MVVRYELAGMDLGEVRFAISPLNEVTLSLRALRDPGRFPLHLRWLQETEPARQRLDLEMLTALTNARFWTPDFLTPAPRTPLARFEDEIAGVARTPARVVREDVAEVHPDAAARPAVLQGRGDVVRRRVVRALRDYWEACFAPYWPRMRAVLEADIVHRGRTIARGGLGAMFADLTPEVSLADHTVSVILRSDHSFRRSTAGEGLTLLPTLFTRRASTPIDAEEPPLIMYTARGVGTLWEPERVLAPEAVAGILGETRAGLLTLLAAPASSTDLAVRLGVTPAAVNQHLRAMRDGGLLISARHGRSVLYRRSDLGDRLVGSVST